jgi:hypothetical protein
MIHFPDTEDVRVFNTASNAKNRGQTTDLDVTDQPAGEDINIEQASLVQRLQAHGLQVVDNRFDGGALWVIGGLEIWPLLKQFEGFRFGFFSSGDRATGRRPGWWTKEPG